VCTSSNSAATSACALRVASASARS
jgi:hypothetical protein